MKFSLALASIALAVSTTDAFTAGLRFSKVSLTRAMAVRADSSELVKEALEISRTFGATSPEARLAWEAVEEVDASDNSVATMGSFTDECDVEVVSQDCLEYNEALEELQELLEANAPKMTNLSKDLATTVEQIKLAAPEISAAPNSKELQAALEEARSITEKEGISSPAAAVAWETVEQIAAAGNTSALGKALTEDECFVEAAREACAALEELNRIVEARKE